MAHGWLQSVPRARWCSDGFEFACWNGEIIRAAFVIDAHDREAIAWRAVCGCGISGSQVRDMMLEARGSSRSSPPCRHGHGRAFGRNVFPQHRKPSISTDALGKPGFFACDLASAYFRISTSIVFGREDAPVRGYALRAAEPRNC